MDADPPVGLSIAMNGERLVRRGTDKGNRPARDNLATEMVSWPSASRTPRRKNAASRSSNL
jgi:hypothetical protein